jgi:hypothetical protein
MKTQFAALRSKSSADTQDFWNIGKSKALRKLKVASLDPSGISWH